MRPILLLALFSATPALAQTAVVDFTSPAEVKLFQSIQLINGVGRVDGDDCDGAFRAALSDAQRVADDREHGTIVAVYDDRPAAGWVSATTLPCTQKGNPPKTSVVKVEALAVQPGTTNAFPVISGARTVEIADALVIETSVVNMQLSSTDIEEVNGKAYVSYSAGTRDETFAIDDSRNTRAVTVFRELITPKLAAYLELVAPVHEVSGLHVSAGAKRFERDDGTIVEQSETFHLYVPTAVAQGFVNGTVSEQELVDQGLVQYSEGKTPVKMDVSFVDAED